MTLCVCCSGQDHREHGAELCDGGLLQAPDGRALQSHHAGAADCQAPGRRYNLQLSLSACFVQMQMQMSQGASCVYPLSAVMSGHNAVCAWLVGHGNPAHMALPCSHSPSLAKAHCLQAVDAMRAGKAVAADSDSEDEDEDSSSNDGSPARSRPLTAPASMGGPLSGGLTIPATMNDPGQIARPPAP